MIVSARPVSFIMKIILSGVEISGIWLFSRNTFSDDFKTVSVVCGWNNEQPVVTARSVGLTALSVAQVDSSLEKMVTPEEVRPHPTTAASVSRGG